MKVWICKDCQREFDFPNMVTEGFSHAFGLETWVQDECPYCNSTDIEHPKYCSVPNCDNGMRSSDKLCKECRKELLEQVNDFFDELTDEQEQQFDDWYEEYGSIKYRKEWEQNDH